MLQSSSIPFADMVHHVMNFDLQQGDVENFLNKYTAQPNSTEENSQYVNASISLSKHKKLHTKLLWKKCTWGLTFENYRWCNHDAQGNRKPGINFGKLYL